MPVFPLSPLYFINQPTARPATLEIQFYPSRSNEKKMTTPSRKLRHTTVASLTVFKNERLGWKALILSSFSVLYGFVKFCNFF